MVGPLLPNTQRSGLMGTLFARLAIGKVLALKLLALQEPVLSNLSLPQIALMQPLIVRLQIVHRVHKALAQALVALEEVAT